MLGLPKQVLECLWDAFLLFQDPYSISTLHICMHPLKALILTSLSRIYACGAHSSSNT